MIKRILLKKRCHFYLDKECQFSFRRSAKQISQYDSRPRHIASGDFNEDGHLDMAVANLGTDNIGIFLNRYNRTFTSQITFSTGMGSRPYSIAIGDVNNDTHLDIVVANFGTNSIGVLLGCGNGSFINPIFTTLGPSRPLFLTLGDLNNDGTLDIAVVTYGTSTLAVLIGTNDGRFRIDRIDRMGYDSTPSSVTLADLNEDNRLDIIVINYGTSELVILLSSQDRHFVTEKYWTSHGTSPSCVATGYLNNDTALDIAVAYSGRSSIGVFLSDGNGSFRSPLIYSMDARSRPAFIGVGDFNNDAALDIAVLDAENGNLVIFKGYGNGSFSIVTQHSTGYNSNPSAFIIGDFDNDHTLDVAIANNGTNNILLVTANRVFLNTTHLEYIIRTDLGPNCVVISDINHDNYLDIVVSTYSNTIIPLVNLGNSTLESTIEYNMGHSSGLFCIVIGDINNDHHLDIVAVLNTTQEITTLFGNDNGTFIYGNRFPTEKNSFIVKMIVDDVNNDGNLDLVTADYNTYNVGLYLGFGNGTFMNMTVILNQNGFCPYIIQAKDMNNDKILDVVVSNQLSTGGIAILFGYGNGSYHNPFFVSIDNDGIKSFRIDDLNNDSRVDIAYVSTSCLCIGVLLAQENGIFKLTRKYFNISDFDPEFLSLGYYNNDSFIDIAVSFFNEPSIGIYFGMGNGSFQTPTWLVLLQNRIIIDLSFADMNNDHQQDIVVVVGSSKTDAIEMFLVHYDTDFTNETKFATGSSSHPVSLTTGDLNNDGQLTIIVANSGNDEIELLFDFNNGNFISRVTLTTGDGSHPQSVIITDFNQDQHPDIAVVNAWTSKMNIFLGLDNGSFATNRVYSMEVRSTPMFIVAGDLNNDGRMDIVIANKDADNVAVFLAFDYVSFTTYSIGVAGSNANPGWIITGDFNNDHLLDLVILNTGIANFGIYLGCGNGAFSEQITQLIGASYSANSLDVADLNRDNCLDIVVSYGAAVSINIFLGYGNGSFQPPITYSWKNAYLLYSATIDDLNDDDHPDIIISLLRKSNGGDIYILQGHDNGSFQEQLMYSTSDPTRGLRITVADLNNDTIPDIIVSNGRMDSVRILFNNGNGNFTNMTVLLIANGSYPIFVAMGDFDRDRSIDIVVANQKTNTISLFFSHGNGSFSLKKTYSISSYGALLSITVSDVNNDGILDILVADFNRRNGSIGIFYGYGDGNFTLPKLYLTGFNSNPYMMVTGDFNNDSKVDLAVTCTNQNSIRVFIQADSEPFGSSSLFSTGNQSRSNWVALGDLNNDGYLDIVVANSGTDNIIFLLGLGNGDFTNHFTYFTGDDSRPSAISIDHFNDDPYLDIAVVNTGIDSISIFLGSKNGSFTLTTTYFTGFSSAPIAIAAKDLNRDKHIDLVISNRGSNEILIFVGKGDGTFLHPIIYSVGYNARPQSVAIVDVNNDGMFDIAVANYESGNVEILLQTC